MNFSLVISVIYQIDCQRTTKFKLKTRSDVFPSLVADLSVIKNIIHSCVEHNLSMYDTHIVNQTAPF